MLVFYCVTDGEYTDMHSEENMLSGGRLDMRSLRQKGKDYVKILNAMTLPTKPVGGQAPRDQLDKGTR